MNNNTSGIYKLVNKINKKYYIGSSKNIEKRKIQHINALNGKYHTNRYLLAAWNKYGSKNFEFVVIEKDIEETQLLIVEQIYLDVAKLDKSMCYNLCFIARGIIFTDKLKKKLSNNHANFKGKNHPMFGRKHTEASKRKNSESNKIAQAGNKNSRYDHTIYKFLNTETKEVFIGTRFEFSNLFGINRGSVKSLVKRKYKKIGHFWIIDL